MTITCLYMPRSARNRFVIVYDFYGWPERVRRHRGWSNAQILYDRPATAEETGELKDSNRMISYSYPDYAALVEDELKYGFNAGGFEPV